MKPAFVVLAGGGSRRMGREKAFLRVGGRELLCRVLDACAGACATGALVVNDPAAHAAALARYDWRGDGAGGGQEASLFRRGGVELRLVRDRRPGEGPVAGMEVGFAAVGGAPRRAVFLAACDLPLLEAEVVRRLAGALAAAGPSASGPEAVVPRVDGRLQHLAAVYERRAGEVAARCLEAGRRRMEDVLDRLAVREVPGASLGASTAFVNVNTPADLDRVGRLLGDGASRGSGGARRR